MEDQIREISERLLGLRTSLHMTIPDFALFCGVDEKEYEDAEGGKVDISVVLLQKVALKSNVTLDELLFGSEPRVTKFFVTRKGCGKEVSRRNLYAYQSLASGFKNRLIEPFLVTISPKIDQFHLNSHEGQEFDMVVSGKIEFLVGSKRMLLEEGDSIYFDASQPHAMRIVGESEAKFLAIII